MFERGRVEQQSIGPLAIGNRANVGQIGFLRAPQVVHQSAGRSYSTRMTFEPEPFESPRLKLIEQRAARAFGVEGPAVKRRDSRSRGSRQLPAPGQLRGIGIVGDDELAGLEDGDLVEQRLQAFVTAVFGRTEFAGRDVEERRAGDAILVARVGHAKSHEKCRLSRVEIARVGQRARRHHAHDFALDNALGFPGILDLIANRHAEALANEPRDVGVDRMKRDTAHRDAAAVGLLRSRGERQLQGTRRHQGVFIEHLVEVAHAKEQDGVFVLFLGVEVLTHCRRCRRGHGRGLV